MSSLAEQVKVCDSMIKPDQFRCENYQTGLISRLLTSLESEELWDIILIAENGQKRVKAHRIILVASSSYFFDLFSEMTLESQETEVKVPNVTDDALDLLVRFMYTGCIELRVETVESLLVSADTLQLPTVVAACSDFMERHLHPSNCLGFAMFAEQRSIDKLLRSANIFVYKHLLEVCKHSEFLQLSFEQFTKIISNDEVSVTSEEDIFRCIIKWIEHDSESRQKHLDDLLGFVRIPLLQPDFIKEFVEPICVTMKSKQMLVDALLCRLEPEFQNLGINNRIRTGVSDQVLLAVNRESFKIQRYYPHLNKWTLWDTPVYTEQFFRVAVVSDNLILVGGNSATNIIANFNLNTTTLNEFTSINTNRYDPCVAVLHESIYVIGGFDGKHMLDSVERWDPVAANWSDIKPMQRSRSRAAVAVLNECLYVVGGRSESALSSVEFYSPLTQLWKYAANMNIEREFHGVAVVKGLLYAVGGYTGEFSMERYDPNTNIWTMMTTTNSPKFDNLSWYSCAKLGNSLIVSYEGERIQEYNTITNVWRELPKHDAVTDFHELVTIPKVALR